ncbi:MAG: hypothetical protein ACTSR8_11385 [Promethearchaeota archaeon]
MTYQVFDIAVLPIFFYYLFLITFSSILTFKIYKKWKERKVLPPLYLTIVFALFTIALVVLTIGLAEAIATGYYKEIYQISLPLAYTMMIIADIFLFKFVSFITDKGKSLFIPLIAIGGVIIVVLFLPWNWWGVPAEDYTGKLNIRIYSTLALILYSYSIYISIAMISRKTMVQTQDKVVKMGFKLLFYSMVWMICFFLMFIFDTLLIIMVDHPGYSEFVYLAWIFAILFYICMYLSLVMPDWLVKRLK